MNTSSSKNKIGVVMGLGHLGRLYLYKQGVIDKGILVYYPTPLAS